MTHKFNVKFPLTGASLQDMKQFLSQPDFHETICRKVPNSNLKILNSSLQGSRYSLKREHNLDVNIPEVAKKFLKDAFKVWREDEWDVDTMICRAHFKMNMPAEFRCKVTINQSFEGLMVDHSWEVDVHVPLIHGLLARHAESEIRRFNRIEMDVIQKEIDLKMTAR